MQRIFFGFSRTETHNTFTRFLDTVNATVELDIKLPATPKEWNKVKKGFIKKSCDGLFDACVGEIGCFFNQQHVLQEMKLEEMY